LEELALRLNNPLAGITEEDFAPSVRRGIGILSAIEIYRQPSKTR